MNDERRLVVSDTKEVRYERFRTVTVAVAGVAGGTAIAVGLPYVTLAYGDKLGGFGQAVIIILALIAGGSSPPALHSSGSLCRRR